MQRFKKFREQNPLQILAISITIFQIQRSGFSSYNQGPRLHVYTPGLSLYKEPQVFLSLTNFSSLEYFGVLCIYDPIYITQFASAYLVVSIYDYMHWTICL